MSGGPSLVGISFSAQLFKCRYLLQYGSTEKSLTCRILTQKVTIPQEFPLEKISTKKSPKKFVSSFRICPQIISRSTATGFCYIVYHLTFDQISFIFVFCHFLLTMNSVKSCRREDTNPKPCSLSPWLGIICVATRSGTSFTNKALCGS